VRITAPRTGERPVPPPTGAAEPSAVYVRSLIRAQLRIAVLSAGFFALVLAAAATTFAVVPEARTATVAGFPVVWLVLGLAVYPVVLLVALLFVRAAGHNERHYRSLAGDEP
jgi:hypothetical protein